MSVKTEVLEILAAAGCKLAVNRLTNGKLSPNKLISMHTKPFSRSHQLLFDSLGTIASCKAATPLILGLLVRPAACSCSQESCFFV
jgi:hypothetical protein